MDKLRSAWRRFTRWLKDHEPVMCYSCQQVTFKKDTIPETTTTGLVVRLCSPCHRQIFQPFDLTPDDVKVSMAKYNGRSR